MIPVESLSELELLQDAILGRLQNDAFFGPLNVLDERKGKSAPKRRFADELELMRPRLRAARRQARWISSGLILRCVR